MKKLFLIAFLFLTCVGSAHATGITVSSISVPGWQYGSPASMRVYVNSTYTDTSGITHLAQSTGGPNFYISVDCTASGTTLTIPSFTIASTTDSPDNPSATVTFIFYDKNGVRRDTWAASYQIPTVKGTTITWAILRTYMAGHPNPPRPGFPDQQQVQAMINLVLPVGKASDVISGTVEVNVPAANSANPIAKGDNDPLVIDAKSFASINAAVAAIGSTSTRLNVSTSQALSGDLVIPSTMELVIVKGGQITGAHTLTINGPFSAGLFQVFGSTVTVSFNTNGYVQEVFPQWFGAVGDDSTDSTVPVQAAINAHLVVHVTNGIFKITGTSGAALVLRAGQTLYGDGPNSILHKSTTATMLQNANDTVIHDLTLRGRSSGSSFIAGEVALQSNYVTISPPFTRPMDETKWKGLRSKIYNLVVENWGSNAIQLVGNGAAGKSGTELRNCVIRNIGQEAVLSFGDGVWIHDNDISSVIGSGIDFQGSDNTIAHNRLRTVTDRVAFGATDANGIVLNGDIWSDGVQGNLIEGNILDTGTSAGIKIQASANYTVKGTKIVDNEIRNFASNAGVTPVGAIVVPDDGTGGSVTDTTIGNNRIYNSGQAGIITWNTVRTTISGGFIDGTGTESVSATSHAGGTISDLKIIGVHMRKWANTANAITASAIARLTIDDVTIEGVTGTPSATYGGIAISGMTAQFSITNSKISLETTHGYGFYITNSASHGVIIGNTISNSALAIFDDSPGDYLILSGNDFTTGNSAVLTMSGTISNVLLSPNNNGLSFTYAELPAIKNGSQVYCSNCNSTCTAGGSTGRMCVRENGAWTH